VSARGARVPALVALLAVGLLAIAVVPLLLARTDRGREGEPTPPRTVTAVCFLTGHGESDLADESPAGLSALAALLATRGYEGRSLDLARGGVPAGCGAVVLAGPRTPLAAGELDALLAHVGGGGRLMVLASPLAAFDPNPLTKEWGIAFLGGLVVDPGRGRDGDVSDLVVEDLPAAGPLGRGVHRLAMPVSGAVVVAAATRPGVTASPLALTSGEAFVESQPEATPRRDEADVTGPVAVAAAAQDVEDAPGGRIVRARVVVTGGAAWATNQFLDDLGNRQFVLNALAWLTDAA
jgi:hypothetical protein